LKNIQILWCLLKYIYVPLKIHSVIVSLINSNMLLYTSKLSWNLFIPHLFLLLLYYFSILSWLLIILPKCRCTCHDMFIGIQKWSTFHETHATYDVHWLIKYLNLKLISWDTINPQTLEPALSPKLPQNNPSWKQGKLYKIRTFLVFPTKIL
jgi:hypothetical protein